MKDLIERNLKLKLIYLRKGLVYTGSYSLCSVHCAVYTVYLPDAQTDHWMAQRQQWLGLETRLAGDTVNMLILHILDSEWLHISESVLMPELWSHMMNPVANTYHNLTVISINYHWIIGIQPPVNEISFKEKRK